MKYPLSILMFFLRTLSFCQSTDSVYVLSEGSLLGAPPVSSSLYKTDPFNANSTLISTSNAAVGGPYSMISAGFNKFIDPHRNKYCFVTGASFLDSLAFFPSSFIIVNNFTLSPEKKILITIDLVTGVWEGVVLEHSHFLQYNCSDSTYYALGTTFNNIFEEPFLVKIDPTTGYSQTISSPLPVIAGTFQGYPFQQPVIDPINKRFIFHGAPFPNPGTGIVHIYSIDLLTGAMVTDYTVNDIDEIHQMAFNCRDSAFYAIKVNYTPNERSLIKIDPITFATSQVSILPYNIWYQGASPTVITVSNNKYVFLGLDSTTTVFKIYSFDIDDGTLTHSPSVNPNDFLAMASFPVCKIDPSISNMSCSGTSVDFTAPSGGIGYEWDFGDPISGIENSSNLQNPEHDFTIPGTYQIRLVLNSCYTNDTVYKTINVSHIISSTLELGPDQLLCPNESLQLSISSDFNTVLWNTGAQTSGLSIITGGVYFVTVTDSLGCLFSDTIQVDYKPEETLTLNYADDSLTGIPYSSNNTWILNGVTIDSSGVNSIFVDQSGVYQLIGDINGCIYTDEIDLNTTLCNLSISPNPTRGSVTVNAHLNNIQRIDVSNTDGKIVKQYFEIESSVFKFDLSELSAGTFFFQIWTDNCESVVKVVKV